MVESKYLSGDIDIIENGVAFRQYDCGWPADHTKSFPSNAGASGGHFQGTLAYLPVPQCMSFQHFIDGLLPKLVQMRHLIAHDKSIFYAVDTSFDDRLPRLILERLGVPSNHVISSQSLPWSNGRLSADRLILSCRVPPLHPKLWQEAQEMLRLPWLESSWKQERRIVLLFSRKEGTRNSGRLILNEDAIVSEISPVLEKKGYELVVFNPSNYKTLDALFDFLANVDMVIGPHGGAFYNILFMRRGITVVECMPEDRYFLSTNSAVHLIIYLQSMLLGDVYYNVLGKASGNDNMMIDPSVILSIIDERIVCDIEGFGKLVVDSFGEGGYDECIKHLDPKKCQFALIEVIGVENKSAVTSRRAKFVFISWVGLETPIIERAKVSTISSMVREFFTRAHIDLQVNTLEEMTKEIIIKELDRAAGSHACDEYIFDITAEDIDFTGHEDEVKESTANFEDLWEDFKKQDS
ncbi:actin-binding protein, cofilin/tropomyosin family, partial [Blastocystis sp. ATCC 50177/Nand II]